MFARVKSHVFIDTVRLEVESAPEARVRAVLRDEAGRVCSTLEKTLRGSSQDITWEGLNHLPYGVYTLELSEGADEMKLRMVKRV
ncbi:MAG TPA: hypothetical protein VG870_09665 [Chitinophagaceae bacterium]|nr:hypothetical protein [Chitinophagaceae bacterium]